MVHGVHACMPTPGGGVPLMLTGPHAGLRPAAAPSYTLSSAGQRMCGAHTVSEGGDVHLHPMP